MGMPIIESSHITRCQAITDIIQSVALEEAAIAHILNAEGEKIQKYTSKESTATHQERIAVNDSVNSMVRALTNLEIVLQSKLELFKDCLCDPCPTTGQEVQ